MKNILDKTVSLRQLLRWLCCGILFAFLIYIYLFFSNAWNMKMGGANPLNSPYRDLIPAECRNQRYPYGGGFRAEIPTDNLLLRLRFNRTILSNPGKDYGGPSPLTCLGATVILGLHQLTVGQADFTQQFQDKNGIPIVTVRVEYHQAHPFPSSDLIEELKESKE